MLEEERILSIGKECRGRSPLPGFGVSPKKPFSFFAAGGKRKKI